MVIILLYDFEVFKHDTLLGVLNEETGEVTQLWDIEDIKNFTRENLNNIWVGYNSAHYDHILLHGILTGKLATEDRVFACSNSVIHASPWLGCIHTWPSNVPPLIMTAPPLARSER